ncbi:MAG: 30S ribosome-binding factor RbfA [Bacteroidales bacterium]|nr:30S ribosome-binding factor RbfA [Bacteroidales bacterium]
MESTRQNKISRLIQQDLGDILLKEMKPVLGQSLITVTKVRVTSDLSIVRCYISIFPVGTMPETADTPAGTKADKQLVINAMLTHQGDIRRRLGLREAKQLRIIPNLEFFLDDSLDYAENIERLLKQ